MQYISEETDQPVTLLCRFADRPVMQCGDDKTAVALRGQWQGGDVDIDPHWIPVCAEHDARWSTDPDQDEAFNERHALPRFPLTKEPDPNEPVPTEITIKLVLDLLPSDDVQDALNEYFIEHPVPEPVSVEPL